jgi:uncharacterized protein involved in response to NO
MGGRVIPFFTARKLGLSTPPKTALVERLSLISMAGVVALQWLVTLSGWHADTLMAALMLVASVANAWRLAHWQGIQSWREPLLWGLHLSYGFIVIGLALWAWQLVAGQRVETALHALAIGSMGTMMLAMIARVSLGHTGRVIRTLPGMGLALAGLLLAAALRSLWLMVFPNTSHWVYSLVIIIWCASYLVFVLHYSLPLLTARPDGKQG